LKTQRRILPLKNYQRLFHIHWNAFSSFIPCVSNALRINGNCVTVVASTGLHFRAFYLLTFAASHDLKETIDKDYCECGMPLETIRESEAPLKERSERV
jgi:hypothetical protein